MMTPEKEMPDAPKTTAMLRSKLKGLALMTALSIFLAGCSEPNEQTEPPQAQTPAATQQNPVSGEDAVNALNGVFGRHKGARGSHAKGFCVAGTFQSQADTPYSYFNALQGETVPVTGRFSIGGGNPEASDKGRSVRGLGIRLAPDTADGLDLVMISAPVFFAATPAQFVEFLRVRAPDPETGAKDAEAIAAFNAANPNVMTHVRFLADTPPPASYATTPYFSTHAFLFDDRDGKQVAARWHFEPVTGFQGLSEAEEAAFPTSFLESELEQRLSQAAAEWIAYLQPAQDGDSLTDPSAPWRAPRSALIEVGRLTISNLIAAGSEDDCTGLVFDPNNLPVEIRPTDDPILALRRPAYAVSFGRRVE